MKKNKVILTGSEGLIGKKVYKYLSKKYEIVRADLKLGLDLTNSKDVKSFFKNNNSCDFLINMHGYNEHVMKNKKKIKKDEFISEDEFYKFFFNNVYSFYLTSECFIKYSKKPKGIINFSSIYSLASPKHNIYQSPKNLFYIASKFAVNGLTKYYATMYGKKTNVNAIANHGVKWKQPKEFIKKLNSHIPKNRMMETEDLYGILELLCSDKSKYINGSIIVVDGGYTAW